MSPSTFIPSLINYNTNKNRNSHSTNKDNNETIIGTEASTHDSISRRDLHGNRESTRLFLENRLIASEGDRETRHMKEEENQAHWKGNEYLSTIVLWQINYKTNKSRAPHSTNRNNNAVQSELSIGTEASTRDSISRRDLHGNRESTRLFPENRLIASEGDRETRQMKQENQAHWKCRIKVVS
ncbi:hypothetical protein CEXT_353421 [Caerostris extrusa]|uniref:Uncharacterized protein n=1 Tax=Caerostris extrusa TaxID=172846 RepID=A0AAV4QJ33_CAEEX|nr:hypothetical protein CEXT_353421 [Caerostris extrusa]